MGTEFVSPYLSAYYSLILFQPIFVNMKFVIALLVLAAAVYAEENKTSPVGQCFVTFVNCAAKADDFMGKAECLKDLSACVSEACRIPECFDAHVKCRKEAKGFVDYFFCNVHYMKCMHAHRRERCKPKDE